MGSDTYTNVLRFKETDYDADGRAHTYKNEWLISKKINEANCRQFSERSRLRWHQEDFHNTAKNRGFTAEHDYARTNSRVWLNWKLLMVLAFSIFELFSHTQMAIDAKKTRSWKQFAMFLFSELLNVPWNIINESQSMLKLKFNLGMYLT